uniref:Uncharacterized protein n=1 Tax=Tanacetum cinerariifolium TaxID=118510 RepID=A0A6L2KLH6_TANCI|nr:hypothetical protein [Tanacetum cinerariifolium]
MSYLRGVTDWYQEPKIIMVNVFLPDHVDDLLDPALAILEHALVDENEEPNEAIDVPVEVEESPSTEPRGSPRDS